MAMAVVLIGAPSEEIALSSSVLAELAQFGITNVAIVRDERTAGLVLEGWAFDPAYADKAAAVVAAGGERLATLRPVLELAVSTATAEGGPR